MDLSGAGGEPLRDELIELFERAFERLRSRLDGLDDGEYLWEPVPGCWTIRPRPGGSYGWDFEWPPPDPPPVTTIAWRLAHLVTDDRFRAWLGLGPRPERPRRTVPGSAAAAVEAVEVTRTERREDLLEVTDGDLWDRIGSIGGPYAGGTRVSWVLHVLDELIHHGAEVATLRDLYRAGWRPEISGSR